MCQMLVSHCVRKVGGAVGMFGILSQDSANPVASFPESCSKICGFLSVMDVSFSMKGYLPCLGLYWPDVN